MLRENEVAEVLQRWESMMNKTDKEKAPLIQHFEEERKKSNQHDEKIHQPVSHLPLNFVLSLSIRVL
ncbi:unnamed protein product [Dibothriocephalus latus]|uniref:Uncharacterized protein n=1 Tax=Dibothriocephalus latus TaxID=60516 RepID=A0A3P7LN13_DIBLA|nr:unnamed protein product [Dibothriocephalus latus]